MLLLEERERKKKERVNEKGSLTRWRTGEVGLNFKSLEFRMDLNSKRWG